MDKSLQEIYAPDNACFGCGVANDKGLRIKSFVDDDGEHLVCRWQPEPHHRAFGNILNGGIIGALLDCHSNWTAAYHLMRRSGKDELPATVTADFHVTLRRPTPVDQPLELRAEPVHIDGDNVVVEATLSSGGKLCATCRGTFVAVHEGHPAFHRW